MNRTNARCLVLLAVGLALLVGARVHAAPSWRADQDDTAKLAPPVAIGAYSIRPPKGYKAGKVHGKGQIYTWTGAVRKDGFTPNLLVEISAKPDAVNLKDDLAMWMEWLKSAGMTGFHRGRSEVGEIGGIKCERCYWTATALIDKKKYMVQGFAYVGKDGGTLICISSQDVEPYQAEALKTAEASAMTFVRR